MKLHSFIVALGSIIILISFITALVFAHKTKPAYYKYIFAFIVFGVLLSVNTIASNNYTWRYGLKIRILIEQLLIFLQYVMFGLFFWNLLKNSVFVKKIKWLFLLSIQIMLILILAVHVANVEVRPSIVPNLVLLVFCFFYLKDLMNNKPTLVLVQSSAFWLVMGILFSSCIGFPVSSLMPFISKNENYANMRFQIFSIQNMSLIIMYLFIIKSYTCLKHPQHS
jgi:hypothetical protein